MEIFKQEPHFDFMGKIKPAAIFSGLIIAASFVSILVHGGLRFGIDFAGGTLVQLQFKTPPSLDKIRKGLKEIGLADSTIQEFGSKNDILIRVERAEGRMEEMGSRIKEALGKTMIADEITVQRVEMVGPKVGKDLRKKAVLSIFYAIIALIHDVIITMGAFSLFDKEFTLVIVAAFLTIIGYSLNDTIVVFDRIRENSRRRRKEPWKSIINTSINQTLSRTLLTSGTTLLVVLALFFLGGEIIHDFSFALLVGIIIGTYSSIFIASVFLVFWEERKNPVRA